MPCEFYELEWNGTSLQSTSIAKDSLKLDDNLTPAKPMTVHSCLGDDNKLWCEVYRAHKQSGGMFLVRDFDEVLMVANTNNNMSFLHGLDFFAKIVSNSRYAADIFENADVDDE